MNLFFLCISIVNNNLKFVFSNFFLFWLCVVEESLSEIKYRYRTPKSFVCGNASENQSGNILQKCFQSKRSVHRDARLNLENRFFYALTSKCKTTISLKKTILNVFIWISDRGKSQSLPQNIAMAAIRHFSETQDSLVDSYPVNHIETIMCSRPNLQTFLSCFILLQEPWLLMF